MTTVRCIWTDWMPQPCTGPCNSRDGCLVGDMEWNQPALNVALEIYGRSFSLTLSFSHFHGI